MSSLGWAAEFNLQLLDTPVVFRVDTAEITSGIRDLLAPFIVDAHDAAKGDCYALVDGDHTGIERRAGILLAYRNDRVIGGGDTWADAFGWLMATLNRQVIEEYEGFALHAGVVAVGEGVIGFPAESGGGKSTLTAACLQAGFDYVSDESLCVDVETGRIVPYPKPLGLSRQSRDMLGIEASTLLLPTEMEEAMVAPTDLGGEIAEGFLELTHVVIPQFGAEGEAVLTEAAGHEAMAALLHFSFNHFKHGERAFTLAAELANQVQVWRLSYDDPTEAAALLKRQFA